MIMGVPVRTLLDGCAGVNSIPEEAVIGALNLAKQQGLKASDPLFPIVQLERWKRKEVITGVRKDAVIRIIGAAVLRIHLTTIAGKPGPQILVRAKIFEAGASEFPGLILGGRALDCVENSGLGFRPLKRAHVFEALGVLMPKLEDVEGRPDKEFACTLQFVEDSDSEAVAVPSVCGSLRAQ